MLAHDISLRAATQQWIDFWREWSKTHPEEEMEWREDLYQKTMAILDARKDLV